MKVNIFIAVIGFIVVGFTLSAYVLFANVNLNLKLIHSETITDTNTASEFTVAVIKGSTDLENWEHSGEVNLPQMDFSEYYYYITNRELKAIHYRRYEKVRLKNPFYYGEFRHTTEPKNTVFVYRTRKIWVMKNYN